LPGGPGRAGHGRPLRRARRCLPAVGVLHRRGHRRPGRRRFRAASVVRPDLRRRGHHVAQCPRVHRGGRPPPGGRGVHRAAAVHRRAPGVQDVPGRSERLAPDHRRPDRDARRPRPTRWPGQPAAPPRRRRAVAAVRRPRRGGRPRTRSEDVGDDKGEGIMTASTRRGQAAAAAGLVLGLLGGVAVPARAASPGLSVFEAFAASRTVTMAPRAAAVISLVVEQYVGATHAVVDSAPRAQGYAATYGVPVASDFRGAGIPVSYGGQCYANYPGEAQVDCGVPAPGVVAPRPPQGGPLDGGVLYAQAKANGDPVDPEKLTASGDTESGGLRLNDVVDIGFSRSRSHTFIDDKGVHALTASAAKDIQVGTALHIASISAIAEAFHGGDLKGATGKASTDVEGVTIGGVPVVIGPEGVMVQGTKLAEAKTPDAEAVRAAMAGQGLTIEPLT